MDVNSMNRKDTAVQGYRATRADLPLDFLQMTRNTEILAFIFYVAKMNFRVSFVVNNAR